jgi:hypothetical protein
MLIELPPNLSFKFTDPNGDACFTNMAHLNGNVRAVEIKR